MGFLADKRYIEIVFDAGKWDAAIGEGGVVVWTPNDPTAGFIVTKSDHGTQEHTNCPPGTTVTTTGGTAIIKEP